MKINGVTLKPISVVFKQKHGMNRYKLKSTSFSLYKLPLKASFFCHYSKWNNMSF